MLNESHEFEVNIVKKENKVQNTTASANKKYNLIAVMLLEVLMVRA
jgi:hypothetical protein